MGMISFLGKAVRPHNIWNQSYSFIMFRPKRMAYSLWKDFLNNKLEIGCREDMHPVIDIINHMTAKNL